MRTTLTLEPDVAAALERVRTRRRSGLKEIVNEALRGGLAALDKAPAVRQAYRTKTVALGPCLIGSIDDVAEALAIAEGDDHR